jgi:hypothetical protein
MGISHSVVLICVLLAFLAYQIRTLLSQIARLEARIDEYHLREQKLIDKLLTRNGHSPLIEREEVIKIPDPEVKQPNFIEEAFYLDAIMEEIEIMNPDMAGRDPDFVREVHPGLWNDAKRRVDALQGPLRRQ